MEEPAPSRALGIPAGLQVASRWRPPLGGAGAGELRSPGRPLSRTRADHPAGAQPAAGTRRLPRLQRLCAGILGMLIGEGGVGCRVPVPLGRQLNLWCQQLKESQLRWRQIVCNTRARTHTQLFIRHNNSKCVAFQHVYKLSSTVLSALWTLTQRYIIR